MRKKLIIVLFTDLAHLINKLKIINNVHDNLRNLIYLLLYVYIAVQPDFAQEKIIKEYKILVSI